jgi:tetratricopeptide (TPR) repeat protein
MSDEEKTESAKKAFGEGKTLFELGKFEQALVHFQRAYELKPVPLLLFNIGQCHRQIGNHQEAVFTLTSFLEQVPDSPDRALVEDLISDPPSTPNGGSGHPWARWRRWPPAASSRVFCSPSLKRTRSRHPAVPAPWT